MYFSPVGNGNSDFSSGSDMQTDFPTLPSHLSLTQSMPLSHPSLSQSIPPQQPLSPLMPSIESLDLNGITKMPYVEHLKKEYDAAIEERNRLQTLYNHSTTQLTKVQEMLLNSLSENQKMVAEMVKIKAVLPNTGIAHWANASAPNSGSSTRLPSNSSSASLAPSDSCSHVPASATVQDQTIHQPAIRPSQYPKEVLWLFDDCKTDPAVFRVTSSNKSRPKMRSAVRMANGAIIAQGEWSAILASANLIKAELLALPLPHGQSKKKLPRTRKYFRRFFPAEWRAAIDKLERLQPLLTLCAAHWKAEKILGSRLLRVGEGSGGRTMKGSDVGTTEEDSSDDEDISTTPTKAGNKRRRSSSATTQSKRRKGKAKEANVPNETETIVSNTLHKAGFLDGTQASSGHASETLDVSFISVNPSLDNLRQTFSHDFPSISHAMDLLDSLEGDVCPGPAQPSSNVSAFLRRIETADPNVPDLSEDEINENWGHNQFTAGSMQCTTVLQSWDEIGVATACRLLAAAIKTCQVARHVCFERGIEVTSYLSDAYLQTLVESLWTAKENVARAFDNANAQAGAQFQAAPKSVQVTPSPELLVSSIPATTTADAPGPSPIPQASTMPVPSTPQEPGIDHLRGMLQVLQKDELRGLLTSLIPPGATDSATKARTKEDLIRAFLSLPTDNQCQLTQETVNDIVTKRKGRKAASRSSAKASAPAAAAAAR